MRGKCGYAPITAASRLGSVARHGSPSRAGSPPPSRVSVPGSLERSTTVVGTAALMGGFAWVQHRMLSLRYPTDVEAMVTLIDQPMPAAQDAGWKYI